MKNFFCMIIALVSFWNVPLFAKVRILTFHYNKPDFIELQYKTFKKFLLDDFEMIVFNDASKLEAEKAIREMCERHEIKCVRFEPEWHFNDPLNDYIKDCLSDSTVYSHLGFNRNNLSTEEIGNQPSIRHCHVIQYALDNYGYDHDDIVAIMDGDAFLIKSLNLREMLDPYDIIGIQKLISSEDVDYLWVVFTAFNPTKIANPRQLKFHVDVINGKLYDSGAHTFHYLNNHPRIKVKKYLGCSSTGFYHWDHSQIKSYPFDEHSIWLIKNLPWPQCVEFHMNEHLLHFGASSFALEGHDLKEQYVKEFVRRILAD